MIHGYGIGLDSIRSDPKHWLGLVREKLLRFNDGLVVGLFAHNWPHAVELDRKPIDVATHVRGDAPWWTALMLLSIASGAGIACVRRADVVWVLMLAYRVAVVIGFYGYARQAIAMPRVLSSSTSLIVLACTQLRVGAPFLPLSRCLPSLRRAHGVRPDFSRGPLRMTRKSTRRPIGARGRSSRPTDSCSSLMLKIDDASQAHAESVTR